MDYNGESIPDGTIVIEFKNGDRIALSDKSLIMATLSNIAAGRFDSVDSISYTAIDGVKEENND